jgi:hypothetical protein
MLRTIPKVVDYREIFYLNIIIIIFFNNTPCFCFINVHVHYFFLTTNHYFIVTTFIIYLFVYYYYYYCYYFIEQSHVLRSLQIV